MKPADERERRQCAKEQERQRCEERCEERRSLGDLVAHEYRCPIYINGALT